MLPPMVNVTPGVKMNYLIRRRAGVSRDELVANWFANHMPGVIAMQTAAAEKGRPHAHRYVATLFDPQDRPGGWDGVAQLWWDRDLPRPSEPYGTIPADTFQQKAEPYVPWPTIEHVALDGTLPVVPNTLNAPFPCTRSGFTKLVTLISVRPGVEPKRLLDHWCEVHAPNVVAQAGEVGAIRYSLSLSTEPGADPYTAISELWFRTADGPARLRELLRPDGIADLLDPERYEAYVSLTEMVGIA